MGSLPQGLEEQAWNSSSSAEEGRGPLSGRGGPIRGVLYLGVPRRTSPPTGGELPPRKGRTTGKVETKKEKLSWQEEGSLEESGGGDLIRQGRGRWRDHRPRGIRDYHSSREDHPRDQRRDQEQEDLEEPGNWENEKVRKEKRSPPREKGSKEGRGGFKWGSPTREGRRLQGAWTRGGPAGESRASRISRGPFRGGP